MIIFCGHLKASVKWHEAVYKTFAKMLGLVVKELTTPKLRGKSNLEAYLTDNPCDFLIYKSANYGELPAGSKGFHIYRDPRDMLVSGYYSTKTSHPEGGISRLKKQRKIPNELNLEDGLISEMDYLDEHFKDMLGWNLSDNRFPSYSFESSSITEVNA